MCFMVRLTSVKSKTNARLITSVFGEFKSWNSVLANQHKTVDIISNDGQTLLEKDAKKDVPD